MSEKTAAERRFPIIAMGLAVAALVIVLIAVAVVIRRDRGAPARSDDRRVAATDTARLQGSAVKIVANGLQVTDVELAHALGLSADDTITAISGRRIARVFDVHEALFNSSMMGATTLYIALERGGTPVLVRWKLDGDLRSARHASAAPDMRADPLLDSIEKIDETHVTMPRSTVDAVLASPAPLASSARIVPSVNNGVPEGFKLYAIRPSSLYARLGLENGDTVRAINGVELSSPSSAIELYRRIKQTPEFVVDLTRHGQPMTLTITVR